MSKGINWNRPTYRAHRERERDRETPVAGSTSTLSPAWAAVLRAMEKAGRGAERDPSGWTRKPKRGG